MKEDVSVVIPTYNRAALLCRAVQSVLEQDCAPKECVVVDDGSTDGTKETVQNIIEKEDRIHGGSGTRIIYERLEANGGACAARNRGIEASSGQYIAFLDSDDVWHKDYLSKQMQFLTAMDCDIAICRMQCMDSKGKPLHLFPNDSAEEGQLTYQALLRYNAASTQAMFGKAKCFREVRFDEAMPRMQDWDEALRLSQRYKVCYQKSILVDTYLQDDSITRHPERGVAAMEQIFAKHSAAILRDNDAAVSFFRKKASLIRQAGGNPAKEYKQAAKHGGGAKDILRAIMWSMRHQ